MPCQAVEFITSLAKSTRWTAYISDFKLLSFNKYLVPVNKCKTLCFFSCSQQIIWNHINKWLSPLCCSASYIFLFFWPCTAMFHLPVLKVLEPRFNVEALALLLNIPPNKTLLRRHLATHFHLLIGSEAQRLKQDCLENPDYTVLTATAKVKVTARGFTTNPPCYREELFLFADSKQMSGTKTGKPKVKK